MTNIGKILADYALLDAALCSLAETFQRKIANSTLRVEDITVDGSQVRFTSVLSWQGDAESMPFGFPQSVVTDRMKLLEKDI